MLLPGNRIRLNVARDFDWRVKGPIRRFFREHGLHDFLDSDFALDDETMSFSHAMLTEAAIAKVLSELRRLRQRFAELHEESLAAPLQTAWRRHAAGHARVGNRGFQRVAALESFRYSPKNGRRSAQILEKEGSVEKKLEHVTDTDLRALLVASARRQCAQAGLRGVVVVLADLAVGRIQIGAFAQLWK